MKCHTCGTVAEKGDKFCLNCGTPLDKNTGTRMSEKGPENENLPAEQAEKLLKEAKRIVKHLSREEQIIGVAALTALFSFFLPWFENFSKSQNGFAITAINNRYLLVLAGILTSLTLLYFGQGAKKNIKILYTSFHAVVGSVIFASEFIAYGFSSYSGILLLTISGALMMITSLYYQKKLLSVNG